MSINSEKGTTGLCYSVLKDLDLPRALRRKAKFLETTAKKKATLVDMIAKKSLDYLEKDKKNLEESNPEAIVLINMMVEGKSSAEELANYVRTKMAEVDLPLVLKLSDWGYMREFLKKKEKLKPPEGLEPLEELVMLIEKELLIYVDNYGFEELKVPFYERKAILDELVKAMMEVTNPKAESYDEKEDFFNEKKGRKFEEFLDYQRNCCYSTGKDRMKKKFLFWKCVEELLWQVYV